ncbi:MarR family transcriptional regulator [Lactobacillus sp. LC28-10]|uniref:MarR family transcriptional regulator n=1 Tax=Secundilactobacillus angelensis TaxID=2722706 RepID=A0ABX1KXD5_9LACO|nr:MarR family transcriptional regulator [Secundilactobacillus angelensis]MCH5461775.1 MarR family transcriptional regulator [Secundilactobacillus angelensis]NLR18614.1 MarR family transcriptional regulator [Secundilactobacillus angelensis]
MNNFGYLIMDVAKELRYQMNTALEKEGITSAQWAVIAQIEISKVPLTAARIAAIVGMDRATISGIVKRLEAKEMITIQPSSEDRRARVLTLTADGEKAFKRCKRIANVQMSDFAAPLAPKEQATLVSLLVKLEEGHHVG